MICCVAYTSLKAIYTNSWYFDSGCSRHMINEKDLSRTIKLLLKSMYHLEMERKDVFKENNIDGLPRLKNVFHVKRLKANLISISQLCDQNLFVKFTKNTCKVFNSFEECVSKWARLSKNCYRLLHLHMSWNLIW